jgi:tRNA pseudouridine65 synthase
MIVLPHAKSKKIAILRGWSRRTNDWLWFNQWWWHYTNAITYFHRLQTTEIELEFNKPTSRYCLVEAIPETGRMHQLRKHFKHIFHPILEVVHMVVTNKINYGWSILNWRNDASCTSVNFNHPITNEPLILNAKINEEFSRVGTILNLDLNTYE